MQEFEWHLGASSFGTEGPTPADWNSPRGWVEYLEKRAQSILERRRREWRQIRKSELLLAVRADEPTEKRLNFLPLWPEDRSRLAAVRVDGLGNIYLPRWRRVDRDYLIGGEEEGRHFALLYPRGRLPRWERLGGVQWKSYSKQRRVYQLQVPVVRGGVETAIRYCDHILGSREFGQMVDVLGETSRLTIEALRKRELDREDLEAVAQSTAAFIVESGLDAARLPEKRKIAQKLLGAAGYFTEEGKRNPLGVMMRLFSARLEAQKRLEGTIAGTRVKYGANAEILRFVRERARRLMGEVAEGRIQKLLDSFSILDPETVFVNPEQIDAQKKVIVEVLSGTALELRREVRVRPYISSAWMVSGLIGGTLEDLDLERARLILGEEGLREIHERRLLPPLRQGKYSEVRQGLIECQGILRQSLEEHL